MNILVTGASGLIGQEIVTILLRNNHIVHYLTTSKKKIESKVNCKGFYWNPSKKEIDLEAFENVEVIINLAGNSIAKRWTTQYKKEVISSRVDSVNLLYETLSSTVHQVKQVVTASAVGIYPDSQDVLYIEETKFSNNSFLAQVVSKWEESVDQFTSLGISVCKLRIGLVLAKNGGALPQLIQPIKWGIGSVFGSGKQIQSWIHIEDLAKMFVFAIGKHLNGVYNAVAPNPVSHRKIMFTIARILSKPLYFPNTPKFIMKLVLGEMHTLLFDSQNVSSQKIQKVEFQFKFTTIEDALKDLC